MRFSLNLLGDLRRQVLHVCRGQSQGEKGNISEDLPRRLSLVYNGPDHSTRFLNRRNNRVLLQSPVNDSVHVRLGDNVQLMIRDPMRHLNNPALRSLDRRLEFGGEPSTSKVTIGSRMKVRHHHTANRSFRAKEAKYRALDRSLRPQRNKSLFQRFLVRL